jgi:glucose/arabinose dehydrogenase
VRRALGIVAVALLAGSSFAPPAAAADCGPNALPPDQHYAGAGVCVRAVAYGQGDLRSVTFASNGDLLAVTAAGEIRRYRDANRDGVFSPRPPETITWGRTDATGDQECRIDRDQLYCRSTYRVQRWRYDPAKDRSGPGEVIVAGIPEREPHGRRPLGVYDDGLYVTNSVTKRFALSKVVPGRPLQWKDGELLEQGVKVPAAIGRGPRGRMAALDDEGVRALEADETIVRLPKGSAASAMVFPDAGANLALPDRWRTGAFIARAGARAPHGSGHDVIWGTLTTPAEVVFGGGREGAYEGGDWGWRSGDAGDVSVSPTGLAVSPVDGALYVTSAGGAIYRVATRGR